MAGRGLHWQGGDPYMYDTRAATVSMQSIRKCVRLPAELRRQDDAALEDERKMPVVCG